MRALDATNCTQAQNITPKTSSKHNKTVQKIDTDNEVKKKLLETRRQGFSAQNNSHKTTEAIEHQATMAQTAARKSHNLKVVSSILTCRKFWIFVLSSNSGKHSPNIGQDWSKQLTLNRWQNKKTQIRHIYHQHAETKKNEVSRKRQQLFKNKAYQTISVRQDVSGTYRVDRKSCENGVVGIVRV